MTSPVDPDTPPPPDPDTSPPGPDTSPPGDLVPGAASTETAAGAGPAPSSVWAATTSLARPTRATAKVVRRLMWSAAVLAGVLGAAALLERNLLIGHIDPDLATTPRIGGVEPGLMAIRSVLVVVLVLIVILGRRWLGHVFADLRAAEALGVVVRSPAGGSLLGAAVQGPPDERAWTKTRVDPMSRATSAAPWFVGISVVVGIAASLLWMTAWSLDVARRTTELITIVGGLWIVAAVVAVRWTREVERRHELAWAWIHGAWPSLPPRRPRLAVAGIALVLYLLCLPFAANAAHREGTEVCYVVAFDCRPLIVQRDQLAGDAHGDVTTVAYGLRFADGPKRGTFIYVVGGPGASGMAFERLIESQFPAALLEAYDIAIFDPRGVGGSDPVDCTSAISRYTSDPDPAAMARLATSFATSCAAESDVDAADLGMFGSAQTVEDIDTIRRDLGADRIVLYGQSYGTNVAQRYAAVHGDRLDALILDGVMDIGQPTAATWAEAARGFDRVAHDTFAACRGDPACARELPDPDQTYARIVRESDARPHLATFADADGIVRDHPIIGATVEQILFYALYDPSGRTAFLAALAAADRSDWVPLGRMAYPAGKRAFVPTASTFTYYATLCADFIADPASPGQDVEGYIRAGERDGLLDLRLGDTYLAAAPCLAWPRTAAAPPPTARLGMTPYPVFVLTAEDDPITTPASAERIAAELGDGYLITTTGGPHVTFGRGFDCPDGAITAFLVDGTRPSSRSLSCPGTVLTPYRSMPLPPRLERLGALEAMEAIATEIVLHPDVQTWDRFDMITTGCRFGGFMTLDERPRFAGLELHDCEVFEGISVSGTGQLHDDGSTLLAVHFQDADLTYEVNVSGVRHLVGTFRGSAVDVTD